LPAVVAGTTGPVLAVVWLPPPPQPIAHDTTTIHSSASMDAKRRRRAGNPHRNSTANTAPPPPRPHRLFRDGRTSEAEEPAVVEMVITVVPLPLPLRVSAVGFKLHVGRLTAPVGEAVNEQRRFMVPEYLLPAAKVAVAVALPPGETEAGAAIETVTSVTVTVVVPLEMA